MKTAAIFCIFLLCLTQAYKIDNQKDLSFLQAQQEPDCCEAEQINQCEVELLENYRFIDINRHLEVEADATHVSQVRFTVTLDTNNTQDWSSACRNQFLHKLSIVRYADGSRILDKSKETITTEVSTIPGITIFSFWDKVNQSFSYEFTYRLVDIPQISKYEQDATDIIEFEVDIMKLNGETIRKHYFRSYIHVNDEVVDTQVVTGQIPKTKIFRSDEDCKTNEDADGECTVIVNYETEMFLYEDAELTKIIDASTYFTVGDHIYGKLRFVDPSVYKYLRIDHFYYNPECCANENEDYTKMTDIRNTAGWLTEVYHENETLFEFITFKAVDSAEVTAKASILPTKPEAVSSNASHLAQGLSIEIN